MHKRLTNLWVLLAVGSMVFFTACKKNDISNETTTTPTPATGTASAADINKDSALSYSKDIYLWYNQIPSTFNARSYADLNALMTGIRQYSIEPGFTAAVDRWSFAVKQSEWDNVSAGISGDFGLDVFFRSEGDLRVKSVERSSPAGLAGIHRGWRITKINGNSNMTTANADFIVSGIWESSASAITFTKPDGTTADISLTAASYQEHPVLADSIYDINGKRIGYFSFNSFLGDTNEVYNQFSKSFNRFAAQGINDLVVDLRYNGGGYVSVQQKLANWLAPSAANGQVMMSQMFNDKYTEYNSTDRFQKLGSLNLSRIFFIVSSSTASASELLINNLKPFMDVQLVGPSKTYGKPVGFFPIPVGDSYIFPVSFRSTNKNGEGNYFNGIALNSQAADGLDKDWGDVTETCLQQAVNYITTGGYRMQTASQRSASQSLDQVSPGNIKLDATKFKGMISTRHPH